MKKYPKLKGDLVISKQDKNKYWSWIFDIKYDKIPDIDHLLYT